MMKLQMRVGGMFWCAAPPPADWIAMPVAAAPSEMPVVAALGDAVGMRRIAHAVAMGRVAHRVVMGRIVDAVGVRGHLRRDQRDGLRSAGGAEHGAVDARGAGGDAARDHAAHVILAGEKIAAQVGEIERGRAVAGAVGGRDQVEQIDVG